MKKIKRTAQAILRGFGQRFYYVKNYRAGFSPVFLLPGSIREKFGEHTFFRTLTKTNKHIQFTQKDGISFLKAGKFSLKFPKHCFYEGDFFDIVYPRLGLHDKRIDTFVYKNPFYESEGCYESFGATLQEGDYVVDAGANIGMFSVVVSGAVGETGKVFAFEPLDEIVAVLEENCNNNHCSNIVIEKDLLGDEEKEVQFFYNLDSNYNASSTTLKKEGDKIAYLHQTTLDAYVKKHQIKKIDFIKADIEGAERDLLRGAEETIKTFKPKLAIRTYHLPDDPEVLYNIIKSFVPEYKTVQHKKTIYAWME